MALKSDLGSDEGPSVAERLDALEKLIDRCKVMYEQYFLGIQKIAPMQLHKDAERGIRELTQQHIRNTALRFRFTTLSQKFGSYNTYWRRIMREIEQGRYIRDVSRVKRRAERVGEEIPEEVLAAMPKRMRDKIRRDRARVAKRAERTRKEAPEAEEPAVIRDAPRPTVHEISEEDASLLGDDLNLDDTFASIREEASTPPAEPPPAPAPPARRAPSTPPPTPRPRPSAGKERIGMRPPGWEKRKAPRTPAPEKKVAKKRAGSLPGGVTQDEARKLYERYVQAKKLVGDSTSKLTYEKMVKTISKQAPRIMKQYGATAVEFNVVLKEDKVILKAKPKK